MNASLRAGMKQGMAFALYAKDEVLDRLAEFDEVRGLLFPNAYTLAENTYFAINGDEPGDFDRDAAQTFWECWGEVDDDFVDGFIVGALLNEIGREKTSDCRC